MWTFFRGSSSFFSLFLSFLVFLSFYLFLPILLSISCIQGREGKCTNGGGLANKLIAGLQVEEVTRLLALSVVEANKGALLSAYQTARKAALLAGQFPVWVWGQGLSCRQQDPDREGLSTKLMFAL